MKSIFSASTALALILSVGPAFAGPTATITDAGNSNVSTVTQNAGVSAATEATITQRNASSTNQAYITQAGAGENRNRRPGWCGQYANVSQDDVGGSLVPSRPRRPLSSNRMAVMSQTSSRAAAIITTRS